MARSSENLISALEYGVPLHTSAIVDYGILSGDHLSVYRNAYRAGKINADILHKTLMKDDNCTQNLGELLKEFNPAGLVFTSIYG